MPTFKILLHTEVVDDMPIVAAPTTRIQQIVGMLLFYAQAVDPTMLCAVNQFASSQVTPLSPAILVQEEWILQYAVCS